MTLHRDKQSTSFKYYTQWGEIISSLKSLLLGIYVQTSTILCWYWIILLNIMQDYELLNQTCSFRQDATPFLKRDTSRRCDVRIEPSDLQFQGSTNLISHQPNDLDWALCRPDRAGQGWAVTGKVSGEDTFSRARWTSSRWSQPSIATLPLRLRSF